MPPIHTEAQRQAHESIRVIDVTGYRCPMPVIRMEAQLRRMAPGERLLVKADDPIAAVDIPHFCRQGGHSALRQPDETGRQGPVCVFLVTRGPNSDPAGA